MKLRKLEIAGEKKGGIFDLIIWMVIAFVTIAFFGLWVYGFGLVTDALEVVPSTESVNISSAVEQTFTKVEGPSR